LIHRASPAFWERYGALPVLVREAADRAFALLKRNPRHPSLHFKKVGRFWSARVGLHYRVIGVDAPNGVLWFWIGAHSIRHARWLTIHVLTASCGCGRPGSLIRSVSRMATWGPSGQERNGSNRPSEWLAPTNYRSSRVNPDEVAGYTYMGLVGENGKVEFFQTPFETFVSGLRSGAIEP